MRNSQHGPAAADAVNNGDTRRLLAFEVMTGQRQNNNFPGPFVGRPIGAVDSMAAMPSFAPSRKSLKGIVAGKSAA